MGYFLHLLAAYIDTTEKALHPLQSTLSVSQLFPGSHYGKCDKHFVDSGHHLEQYPNHSGIWQTEEGKGKRRI